jgi:hypothetical protein
LAAWACERTSVSSQNFSIGRLEMSDDGSISASCIETTPQPPSAFIARMAVEPFGISGEWPVACGTA